MRQRRLRHYRRLRRGARAALGAARVGRAIEPRNPHLRQIEATLFEALRA